jgi:hypothetical protein
MARMTKKLANNSFKLPKIEGNKAKYKTKKKIA